LAVTLTPGLLEKAGHTHAIWALLAQISSMMQGDRPGRGYFDSPSIGEEAKAPIDLCSARTPINALAV
jgi:hypothetical protein